MVCEYEVAPGTRRGLLPLLSEILPGGVQSLADPVRFSTRDVRRELKHTVHDPLPQLRRRHGHSVDDADDQLTAAVERHGVELDRTVGIEKEPHGKVVTLTGDVH